MGSMPVHSVLKGPIRAVAHSNEPILLHQIFEYMVKILEKLENNNNNNNNNDDDDKEVKGAIHSIVINRELSQDVALIYEDREITFVELNKMANKLGRSLISSIRSTKTGNWRNLDGDFIVAVCLEPSDMLIVTLLACWKIGAAYMPIDPTFPDRRIGHILQESEPVMVIINGNYRYRFNGDNVMDIESLRKISESMPDNNIMKEEYMGCDILEGDCVGIVLYTSGSTGTPKGVRIPHSAVLNRLKWQWKTFPYSESEKICIFKTALTFVDSVAEIWGPLLNARSLLIYPKDDVKNIEKFVNSLESYKIERLVLVPTLLHSILMYMDMQKIEDVTKCRRLKNLRLWVCSGEPLSMSLVQHFFKVFNVSEHRLCNFYGSTEVMGDVTYHVIENLKEIMSDGKIPIGKPVDNCVIYMLDEKQNLVNMGKIGEIYVSGSNLALGYVRNRDSKRFIDNNILVDSGHRRLYRTGDFGQICKNMVYYEGRTDSQIKVRGHRVDISEVEAAVKKIEHIKESAVIVYNAGEMDQTLLAFVVHGPDTSEKIIEATLRKLLSSYMMPQVISISSLPLLVNGKVDRQTLLKTYKDRNYCDIPAGNIINLDGIETNLVKTAEDIFNVVADVLGKSLRCRISGDGNFFQMGGNSLNSIYFVSKLHDMGYNITVRDFLTAPTLMDVVRRVRPKKEAEREFTDETSTKELQQRYKVEMISEMNRQEMTEILCTSFYEKADLERYLTPSVPYSDYEELIDNFWNHMLDGKMSFVVRDANGQCVGAVLNMDAYEEPSVDINPKNQLRKVFSFLEHIEVPLSLKYFPQEKGKVLHNFMMGSKNTLTPQETIELFIYMEAEVLKLAKSLNFEKVFTSNTSPLTQQISLDVLQYEVISDYQANKYVAPDGTKPFETAPDSVRNISCWKSV